RSALASAAPHCGIAAFVHAKCEAPADVCVLKLIRKLQARSERRNEVGIPEPACRAEYIQPIFSGQQERCCSKTGFCAQSHLRFVTYFIKGELMIRSW